MVKPRGICLIVCFDTPTIFSKKDFLKIIYYLISRNRTMKLWGEYENIIVILCYNIYNKL